MRERGQSERVRERVDGEKEDRERTKERGSVERAREREKKIGREIQSKADRLWRKAERTEPSDGRIAG